MSVRSVARVSSSVCRLPESAVRIVCSESKPTSSSAPQTARRLFHSSPDGSTHTRLEGIQGPLSTPVMSVKDSRRLLDLAAKHARSGTNLQGVQGSELHTDEGRRGKTAERAAVVDWDMDDTACPQGVQGVMEDGLCCPHFATWLDNCRRYGLANCDQQLQGIQTGRLTLAQVLADQEARIAEIAESYRKRHEELPTLEDESFQGAQGDLHLPDIGAPCPQGVQGDDCVRFKLWLENCHRFGMHECLQQLQGFQDGRLTLAQIFAQQDAAIREVVQQYQRRQSSSQ